MGWVVYKVRGVENSFVVKKGKRDELVSKGEKRHSSSKRKISGCLEGWEHNW